MNKRSVFYVGHYLVLLTFFCAVTCIQTVDQYKLFKNLLGKLWLNYTFDDLLSHQPLWTTDKITPISDVKLGWGIIHKTEFTITKGFVQNSITNKFILEGFYVIFLAFIKPVVNDTLTTQLDHFEINIKINFHSAGSFCFMKLDSLEALVKEGAIFTAPSAREIITSPEEYLRSFEEKFTDAMNEKLIEHFAELNRNPRRIGDVYCTLVFS